MVTGGFFPVIDGEVLPRSTYESIADGETAWIPVVVGTVRDEFSMFMLPDPAIATLNELCLLARVEALTADRGQEAIDLYRRARGRGDVFSPPALWIAMMTDHDFFAPAMRFAALQSDHARTYAYLFTWPAPVMGGVFGSIHGLELPFLWGIGNAPGLSALFGDLVAAKPLSTAIQDAWLAFARTGHPSAEGLDAWPGYRSGPCPRHCPGSDQQELGDNRRRHRRRFLGRVIRSAGDHSRGAADVRNPAAGGADGARGIPERSCLVGAVTGVTGVAATAFRPWLGWAYALYGLLLFVWLIGVAIALWRLEAETAQPIMEPIRSRV
jgi:carboxylesterase type B